MSTRDSDVLKDKLLENEIKKTDTISQFMEKCNNNFTAIAEWGGGPEGAEGEKGDPGVPTKPKVPIHVWIKGKDYDSEPESLNGGYEIIGWKDDELTDVKYQEGHLIILENAHVYILEEDKDNNYNLKPKFILALHSYNSGDIVNGQPGYVHFAYANSPDGFDGFITDDDIRNNSYGNEPVSTFNLQRNSNTYNISAVDMPYMGVYSDNTNASPSNPSMYTWIHVQGAAGATGPKGEQGEKGDVGDKGDDYTGHPYTIDLEGDLSTISIGINGTRLYDNDYCECKLHAYYGDENVELNLSQVSINLPEEYKSLGNGFIVLKSNESEVGQIIKSTDGKDAIIQFTPDKDFVFPKKTITFTIHVETEIFDENDKNTYKFVRDIVWMIKGISSTFELEIQPQYRTIKLFEDGKYYPEKLLVNVYKVEDGERTLFDFSQNTDFKLLYKNYNDNEWMPYINGVSTDGVSCLEFKVIRYPGSDEPEMWDYEDVWVVADGKSSHYYHADLGNTESMMILTTGEKINIGTDDEPIYCADIRNESGYSITFEPKFYDGTDEIEVTNVSIGANSGEEYYTNGTFKRELTKIEIDGITKYTFTITKVPYGVEIIPMNFVINATSDDDSEYKSDTVSFNVYISTLSNIYTLVPTVSSYNTSTGKTGDTIGCNVYKNNTLIETGDLYDNGLKLKYVIHDGGTDYEDAINYTEPLVYGHDDDNIKDEFTAKDVAIEFILYYKNKEVVKSTVPLIKDGIDGKDGDSWQYIFCRSPYYPFDNPNTKISDPSTWTKDPNEKDSNSEYLGDKEDDYTEDVNRQWYDDHKGVDSEFKYEYQSYRKWNKKDKVWGNYGSPTLYSNFSESGSGYSVLLSNPVSVIPVGDDDWSVNENNKNQEDSTLVYLYSNTLDMSKDPNVTITLPENNPHFKPIKTEDGVNKVIFTPVVNGKAFDFGSNSQYKLPITLTYSLGKDADGDDIVDNFTTIINWTLTPTKGLSDVEVFVDNRVVNISSAVKHSLKVGYYLISSNGTKTFIGSNDPNTNTKGYKIILTDDIKELSSGEVTNWQNAEYTFVKNGENRNCYVVLVDSEGNKLDYINITAVNNGKDGASPIHLELTQDYISVPCSADGSGVHPKYKSDIRSQMKLYNGDKLIENGITYSFKVNGTPTTDITTSNDGKFNIPTNLNLISGDTNIECIATYNEVDFHKILTIDLKETPYELELNKSVLTRDVNDGNKIIDKNIVVRVKYWMGGKWVYTQDGEVKANTTNGKENLQFGSPTGDTCDRHLMIEGSELAKNTKDTEVRISYYNGGDVELSYETIGIISNGKDGVDGKDGKDGVDGKDGKDGVDGKDGKTVYPAGKWDTSVTYTSTENTTPYVVHNDEYWQLVVNSSKGAEPGSNNSDWIKFDKFEALFAKIGMIDNGTFGAAVFSGNYMFSQYGINSNGDIIGSNGEYKYFDNLDPFGENKSFYPNFCVNFLTGKVWMNAGKTIFDNNGSGQLSNGNITWNNNGEFNLGTGAISYDYESQTVSISGENVKIEGDVKINGDAVLTGIKEIEDSDDFKTIISKNIITDRLDTNPSESGDKIVISGNNLNIYNNENKLCAKFCSDEISTESESLDIISNGGIYTEKNSKDEDAVNASGYKKQTKEVLTTSSYNCGYIYASDGNKPDKPGTINITTSISFKNNIGYIINCEKWQFRMSNVTDDVPPYTLNGKFMYAGFIIYKNNIPYDICPVNSTGVTINTTDKERHISYTYTVTETGDYQIIFYISAGGVLYTNNPLNGKFRFTSRCQVYRNTPKIQYTEIGKNGIIVRSNNGYFLVNNDEITFNINQSDEISYGFKINQNGYYYKKINNEISSWSSLDFNKIQELETELNKIKNFLNEKYPEEFSN